MKILHIRRVTNARLDALAELTASLSVRTEQVFHVLVTERKLTPLLEALPHPDSEGFCSVKMDIEPIEEWRIQYLDFLERGRLSDNPTKKVKIKRRVTKSVILKDVLYKQSLNGILLQSVANHETHEAVSGVHSGVCVAH